MFLILQKNPDFVIARRWSDFFTFWERLYASRSNLYRAYTTSRLPRGGDNHKTDNLILTYPPLAMTRGKKAIAQITDLEIPRFFIIATFAIEENERLNHQILTALLT